jgi:hypothetical protein
MGISGTERPRGASGNRPKLVGASRATTADYICRIELELAAAANDELAEREFRRKVREVGPVGPRQTAGQPRNTKMTPSARAGKIQEDVMRETGEPKSS